MSAQTEKDGELSESAKSDDAARWVHQMDQLLSATKQMAHFVFTYYKELLEAGFDEERALMLTDSMQTAMFRPRQDGGG